MSLDGRIRQGLVGAADSVQPNVEGDLMQVVERNHNRRRIQWAAAAVAVAAIGAFLFLGGTDLFDSTGDTDPIPPASTGDGSPTVAPTTESSPSAEPDASVILEVWFTKGETLYSVADAYVSHVLPPAVAGVALEHLLNRVDPGAGLATEIPGGTELLGVDITNGVATVDLSNEFESGGGSLSMRMRVAQVVYTLTQFETVKGVLFEIDGELVDSIGGEGIDVSTPQTRKDYEDLLPAITVTTPGIGWDFTSAGPGVGAGIIEGTANVFEANVSWRILDENGKEIASGFTTASCGTGCRGNFRIEAEFSVDHDQDGTIEVLEYSAENGEPINVVSIPVTLLSE
ncbi:MAG: GerMN domain-containing protein [Actinobacteria bacterium]|nr:GerMN domain-containing protein [Actinomycetota bacterium]